jgi:hypothetical protein
MTHRALLAPAVWEPPADLLARRTPALVAGAPVSGEVRL